MTVAHSVGDHKISSVSLVRDLGILIDSNLKFSAHIEQIVSKGYQRLNLIFRAFCSRNLHFLRQMYITYIRPVLEYNTPIWNPSAVMDLKRVENVQRSFSRRVPGLSHLSYFERLAALNLQTLEERRLICDLGEVYKIVTNLSCLLFGEFFDQPADGRTRGHSKRLAISQWRLLSRKHSFAVRVVPVWNSLPEAVVAAPSFLRFSERLKKVSQFLKLNAHSY